MNELLSKIRLVKFFNWENFFEKRAGEVREEEMKHQRKSAYAQYAFFGFRLFMYFLGFFVYVRAYVRSAHEGRGKRNEAPEKIRLRTV
jgi:hypothetical protein